MASPAQVTIGNKHTQNTKESTSSPKQVTICAANTHNSMDTNTRNNWEEDNGGGKGDDDGDDYIASTYNLGLVCASRHVEAIINSLSGNTDEPPPLPPKKVN